MNTIYSLHDFRIFDKEGAKIKLSPITILTGCNSSGKSSIVKSMVLLRDFIEQGKRDFLVNNRYNPRKYPIDFGSAGINLSNFNSVINRKSKNKEFILSYTIAPLFISFKVELYFSAKDNDFFNHGWLSKIIIYEENEKIVLSAKAKDDRMTLETLSITANLEYEFAIVAFASTLKYMINQRNSAYDEWGEYIEDQEKYDLWNSKLNSFIDGIKNNKNHPNLNSHVGLAYDKLQKFEENSEFKSLEKDLSLSLNHQLLDSMIFYFPILENFKGKSKEEAIELIKSAETVDYLNQDNSMHNEAAAIAEDFAKSDYESFLEYFLSFENIELENIAASSPDFGKIENFDKDFIDGLNAIASIRYDPGTHVHFLGSSDKETIDFNKVYKFLSRWQWKEGLDSEIFSSCTGSGFVQSSHNLYSALLDYVKVVIRMALNPDFFSRLKYIGNFQSDVKRIYLFDDNESKLCKTIKLYLQYRAQINTINKNNEWIRKRTNKSLYKPGDFVNKWIKKLNIGKSLNVIEDEDGLGAKLFLRKDSNRRGYPLADEGYGISQLVTFLLNIENEILEDKIYYDSIRFNPNEDKTPKRATATISLEEPEVSLHPSMQSKLADIFIDAYENYGIHFIIETHSEYLIRRTQAVVAQYKTTEEYERNPFSVVYVGPHGNTYELEYTESGRFNRSFGPGFFDEASRSCVEILKRERKQKNG